MRKQKRSTASLASLPTIVPNWLASLQPNPSQPIKNIETRSTHTSKAKAKAKVTTTIIDNEARTTHEQSTPVPNKEARRDLSEWPVLIGSDLKSVVAYALEHKLTHYELTQHAVWQFLTPSEQELIIVRLMNRTKVKSSPERKSTRPQIWTIGKKKLTKHVKPHTRQLKPTTKRGKTIRVKSTGKDFTERLAERLEHTKPTTIKKNIERVDL
jgi:hypothetical protein